MKDPLGVSYKKVKGFKLKFLKVSHMLGLLAVLGGLVLSGAITGVSATSKIPNRVNYAMRKIKHT